MAYMHIDDKFAPYLEILLDCIKLNGTDIEEQVKRIVEDTSTMGECLEDNFLSFKLHSKKVRDEYEKAVRSVEDLKAEIDSVNSALEKISVYKAERLIELIEKFNSMPDSDKEILSKLLEISREV